METTSQPVDSTISLSIFPGSAKESGQPANAKTQADDTTDHHPATDNPEAYPPAATKSLLTNYSQFFVGLS